MSTRHPSCTFDEEAHAYAIEGFAVPSVTQVLGVIMPGFKASDWYKEVGSTVHACMALIGQGKAFNLDLSGQTPEDRATIEGKIAAGRAWYRDNGVTAIDVERRVYSVRYRFAGTLDLVARVPTVDPDMPILVDFKGTLAPQVKWQLAAYSLADAEGRGRKLHHGGVGVQLNADGTWKMSELYDLRRARNEFLAMLTTYGIRKGLGYTE